MYSGDIGGADAVCASPDGVQYSAWGEIEEVAYGAVMPAAEALCRAECVIHEGFNDSYLMMLPKSEDGANPGEGDGFLHWAANARPIQLSSCDA